MKKIILLAFLFCSQFIVAQLDAQSGIYKENEVDTKPSFPGGLKAYTNFVNKNFNWTNNKNSKSVTLEFTVQTNGIIVVNNVSSVGSGNEIEAVRVIGLSPKWNPATVKGKKVVCTIVRTMYNPNQNKKEEIAKAAPIQEPVDIAVAYIPDSENSIYSYANIEEKPEYPGGLKQFDIFFKANFKMHEEAKITEKVIVSFVIEKDGSLSDIKVRDTSTEIGNEIIRVFKMARKWIPGKQNGKMVRTSRTLPILIDNSIKTSPENK